MTTTATTIARGGGMRIRRRGCGVGSVRAVAHRPAALTERCESFGEPSQKKSLSLRGKFRILSSETFLTKTTIETIY